MCSLIIHFTCLYCSCNQILELASSLSTDEIVSIMQCDQELRDHVALLHLILSTTGNYIESPGSQKEGDILIYLGFQLLVHGFVLFVSTDALFVCFFIIYFSEKFE